MSGARALDDEEQAARSAARPSNPRPGYAIGQFLEALGWGWLILSVIGTFTLMDITQGAEFGWLFVAAALLQGVLIGTAAVALGRMSRSIAEMRYK